MQTLTKKRKLEEEEEEDEEVSASESESSMSEEEEEEEPPKPVTKRAATKKAASAPLKQVGKMLRTTYQKTKRQQIQVAVDAISELIIQNAEAIKTRIEQGETEEIDGETQVRVCKIEEGSKLDTIVSLKIGEQGWIDSIRERIEVRNDAAAQGAGDVAYARLRRKRVDSEWTLTKAIARKAIVSRSSCSAKTMTSRTGCASASHWVGGRVAGALLRRSRRRLS